MRSFWILLICLASLQGAVSSGNMSLECDGMDIRAVLKLITNETNLNIVVSPEVRGSVTASFKNVSGEQILKSVVQSMGYVCIQDGVVYRIGPRQESIDKRSSIRRYRINYAQMDTVADELIKMVPSLKGKIMVSKETNSVLVRSAHPDQKMISDIIERLDTPPMQVMVEAKIFEVSAEESKKFGAKFLSNETAGTKTGFETFNLATNEQSLYVRSMNKDMEMYLSSLETKSDLNMLSSPKVIAVNNREASLETQSEYAYQDETVIVNNGNTVTSKKTIFKDVGTKLKFIPHINDKGYISIDLYPEVSSVIIDTATQVPLSQVTKVHTQVVVKDGDTFLLGGLLRDREETLNKKIPILGDIWFIGELFKRSEKSIVKKEVIIMITPKIMK